MMEPITPEFILQVDEEIILKMLSLDDVEKIFTAIDANRRDLGRFLGWVEHTRSERDTRQFVEKEKSRSLSLESLTLSIWVQGRFVGLVGFHEIDFLNRVASIGYWLSKDSQGKGVMTRSVRSLIAFGFGPLQLHRMEIRCAVSNIKSQKIALKLGFVLEATLKEACWNQGICSDMFLFSLLSSKNT